MIRALIGLLLPAAAMWPVARSVPVAIGAGIGLSSLTTVWLLACGVTMGSGFVAADAVIWTTIGVITFQRFGRGRVTSVSGHELPVSDWIVRILFGLTATIACAVVVAMYRTSPHGQWDAWAIWNHRARFLFLGGGGWTAAISDAASSHADYPLLVPASVARLWAYAGRDATIVPALLAIAFGVSIVMFVLEALDGRRTPGWLAATVLLAGTVFVDQVAAQCADVPLAFFIVATLGLISRGSWLAGGAMGALAAWTKNEGLLFLAITSMFVLVAALRQRDRGALLRWSAGAVPVVATIVWFKVALAPPVDLTHGMSLSTTFAKLLDANRHVAVLQLFGGRLLQWGGPLSPGIFLGVAVIAVVLSFRRIAPVSRMTLSIVLLMLVGYYTVYVLTPNDLVWHVSTSADRLLTQLWPALVLAIFCGSPASGRQRRKQPDANCHDAEDGGRRT